MGVLIWGYIGALLTNSHLGGLGLQSAHRIDGEKQHFGRFRTLILQKALQFRGASGCRAQSLLLFIGRYTCQECTGLLTARNPGGSLLNIQDTEQKTRAL